MKTPKNKFELKYLKLLTKLKVRPQYEPDKLPYVYSGHYTPDFKIFTPSGIIYLETKGYFRPEHKRVMAAAKRTNPALDIRIIFYAKKLKDIKWAEKYGFPWAVDEVPKEWLL